MRAPPWTSMAVAQKGGARSGICLWYSRAGHGELKNPENPDTSTTVRTFGAPTASFGADCPDTAGLCMKLVRGGGMWETSRLLFTALGRWERGERVDVPDGWSPAGQAQQQHKWLSSTGAFATNLRLDDHGLAPTAHNTMFAP